MLRLLLEIAAHAKLPDEESGVGYYARHLGWLPSSAM